jgi:hypothetical protein
LLGAALCAGAIAYVALRVLQSWHLERARRRATQVAERLRVAEVEALGIDVTCRFVLRATEHWDHAWTEISARSRAPETLPSIEIERAGPPGSFGLRAESGGRATSLDRALEGCASIEVQPRQPAIAAPDSAEVLLGDDLFDDAFEVRIAPRALAAVLLDRDARARLLALYPVAVRQRAGGLLLEKRGYLADGKTLASAVAAVAGMTARASDAAARLSEGTSYRGEGRITAEARRNEMTILLESMARRARGVGDGA